MLHAFEINALDLQCNLHGLQTVYDVMEIVISTVNSPSLICCCDQFNF